MNVSVIGLGKLGASMAAAFAKRGLNVIGVDINPLAVEHLAAGRAPVQETDLDRTISENKARIRATLSHAEAVRDSEISFVIVPTPSDEHGAFSLQYAAWVFREMGRALAGKRDYHNVVLTSTVLPGATRHGLLPVIEKESGKRGGRDFGLCYSPEFIALGSILRDFLNPDFTLVGEVDDRAGSHLESLYARVMENGAPCMRMSIENAELTKISVNTFVTTKITFANMLAALCERIPGGDVDAVTRALGCDRRIGSRYLKGAMGYGGPCFPRDNVALGYIARSLGIPAELAETTDRMNRSLAQRIIADLAGDLRKGMTVAVLGLAYKPFSHVVEESQALVLVRALADHGIRVVAFDPLAGDEARRALRDQAVVLDSIGACLEQAEAVLIATPDPAFGALGPQDFQNAFAPVLVVDFWRLLAPALRGRTDIRYRAYGCCRSDADAAATLSGLWSAS